MASSLLVDVLAALGSVTITTEYLIDGSAPKRNYLHGTQQPGHITINEAPSSVSIVLHELIHEVRPDWSERSVSSATTRLQRRQLSHDDIQAIYATYQRRKQ